MESGYSKALFGCGGGGSPAVAAGWNLGNENEDDAGLSTFGDNKKSMVAPYPPTFYQHLKSKHRMAGFFTDSFCKS